MYKKINSYFLIIIILFSMFPVKADAPIKYYEIDSDIELRGAIFVNIDPVGFYASLNNGIIQIDSNNHYNDVMIKFKGIALNSRLKKYNGFNVGYTHISNNGIITNELKSLEIDYQGFAYLNTDFSTVIINGMTGITTTTLNGLSGNQSISVPNGSSYDLNITNNQEENWFINGYNWTYKNPFYMNATASFSDVQFELNETNFVLNATEFEHIETDGNSLPIMNLTYSNNTIIPFWVETWNTYNDFKFWVKASSGIENQTLNHYYNGNPSVSSGSNGSDTFYAFTENINTHTYMYFNLDSVRIIGDINCSALVSEGPQYDLHPNSDTGYLWEWDYFKLANQLRLPIDSNHYWTSYTFPLNQSVRFETIADGTTFQLYVDNVLKIENTSMTPVSYTNLFLTGESGNDIYTYEFTAVCKYTTTGPTWAADGEEQTDTGIRNITASVTGDSNEQSYNISQSKEFTLTPTGTTNNILINTASTNYDVTIITYWTENTILQSEIAINGYAKQYINYTPSFNITSADLNTTFTFNFSAQDYIGTTTSTLNDVSKTTIRNEQHINASVGNLIKYISYYWNVTVPYNNIFTLSNQSDITAYLGISKQFYDSTYNDPDNNPILSRLWDFGDSTNINISDPTHIYTSLGVFNANYSVTEDATTNSQTITKEFNVSVEVQPPQNVTTVSYQTNVSINWDDYTYADKYSVYELEDGFSYVDIDPVIDGVKDAIYNYAHEFLIFSPNPINHGDYETIYPLRTVLGAYLLIESIDNDDKSGDDDTIYYFDLDNDGLTVNDPAWKITDNIIKKYLWNSNSWQITGSTNAVGDSTGGGTHYPIHELFIPVAELGSNWINGSTVKILVKREDSSLHPDVITWYPYGNINNTDTNLWQEMVLNDPESYNLLTNITLSNYTAINLTPFTIYHGAVSSWNGSIESNYTLFDVITKDIPFYNVSGYILDDLGNKLSGAIIYSCNGFVHEITQSDIYGYWIGYNFREGNYTICGNKSGYITNSTDIYVSSNMSNVNVTLTAYTITDWEIYQKLLLLESQNDEILLNISINNTIVNDKIDTILIFILLNMAVIVGIIIGKRGKDNDK